ncbi:ribosomal RNA small subunit methyltransferase I [Capsulimonas corticalis]|uniref:Ribosomal RNA small subunit methyltransferase I n=1 Tax=Capsulimonas corticalis TaxID=2219043 RepID=A0A402D394_9BACT|nr:16S rRNA (cytidine(1402)-2'-O)-methyltransferase [Capsulimonas corticalis]BDI28495.1 ribosomal RNA small subunit methyltransferase I [Capsulimonas corticalis]
MPGTLYIVATPIGNLEDITLRALRILKEADLVAAEDTRHTLKLLAHFEITTPLISFHQHSEADRADHLVHRMAENGQSIALVTDAGTPGVSDPGVELVRAAIEAGVTVVPIPGASAVLSALVGSGLPPARFAFEGFLPRTKSDRREKLTAFAAEETRTLIFYEAPNRTRETLADMRDIFGPDRPAAVGRELTKKFEEFVRGPLSEVLAHFIKNEARGEITIVVAGRDAATVTAPEEIELSPEERMLAALKSAVAGGASERDAVRQVSTDLKLSKRDVYAAMLALKK